MLHAAPSVPALDPRPMEVADYHDVWPVVRSTERLELVVPRAIMTIFIGLPILLGLLHGHPILGLINAFLLTFVGALLCRIVAVIVLAPLHAVRYAQVVRRLAATLDALAPDARLTTHWMAGAPGALAITRLSTVLLVDRSTDYRFIALADDEIVAVDRKADEDVRTTSRHRPALTLGAGVRGLFGAWTFGGRTITNARVTRSHTIILRYQRKEDRDIRCSLIPFGADEMGAGNLWIALDRIRNSATG